MGGFQSIARGFRFSFGRIGLAACVYLANCVFAVVLIAPWVHGVSTKLAHSTSASRDDGGLDAATLLDVAGPNGLDWLSGGAAASGVSAVVLLVAVFLSTILSGGVLACLRDRESRFSVAALALGCVRYAGRLSRLAVIACVGYAALQWCNGFLDARLDTIFVDREATPSAELVAFGKTGAMIALVFFFAMTLDYARVRLVVEDRKSALGAFATAFVFWARAPFSTTAIQLAVRGADVVLLVLTIGLMTRLPAGAWIGIVAVQQIGMAARAFVTVGGHAARLDWFERCQAARLGLPVEEVVYGPRDASQTAADEVAEAEAARAAAAAAHGIPLSAAPTSSISSSSGTMPSDRQRPGGDAASGRDALGGPSAAGATLLAWIGAGLAAAALSAAVGITDRALEASDPMRLGANLLEVEHDVDAFLVVPERDVDGTSVVTLRNAGNAPVRELVFRLGPVADAIAIQAVRHESTGVDLARRSTIADGELTVTLPEPLAPNTSERLRIHFRTHLPRRAVAGPLERSTAIVIADWLPRLDGVATYRVELAIPEGWDIVSSAEAVQAPVDLGSGGRKVFLAATDAIDLALVAAHTAAVDGDGGSAAHETELALDRKRVPVRLARASFDEAAATRLTELAEGFARYVERRVAPYSETPIALARFPLADRDRGSFDRTGLVVLPWRFLSVPGDARTETELAEGLANQWLVPGDIDGPDAVLLAGAARWLVTRYLAERIDARPKPETESTIASWIGLRTLERGIEFGVGPTDDRLAFLGGSFAPFRFDSVRLFGRPIAERRGGGTMFGAALPPEAFDWPGLSATAPLRDRMRYLAGDRATNGATRQALVLETIAAHVGFDVVRDALRKHLAARALGVMPGDVMTRALREHGATVSAILDELAFEDGEVDFAITDIAIEPVPERRIEQERPGDHRARDDEAANLVRSRVFVEQRGWARLPATVRCTFADGTEREAVFAGDDSRAELVFDEASPIVRAEIDPERRYALDLDFTNNGHGVDADWTPAARLGTTMLFWMQTLVGALASLA